MRKFIFLLLLLLPFVAMAQTERSIEIDASSFAPVQTDAISGVAIDKIGKDRSNRECARIKMRINRMTAAEIGELSVRPIGGNVEIMRCVVASEGDGLIIEMTAKQPTRFYITHPKYGNSNEVSFNLEGGKEYRVNAELRLLYTIVVTSDFDNVEVYVDGVYKGVTDSEYRLYVSDITPGEHKIKLQQGSLEAEQILDSDDYSGEGIEEFQHRGGSPGGARPKIFTRYEDKEWLVKFRAKHDSKRIGLDEYSYSLLAKECGIVMPETRLFEDKYFGVERFDRTPSGKLHVVSIAGLIGADYRMPSIDYSHIFQVCAALTHSVAELWRVYRLMVFNYLIENKDDHAKNFAFIYHDDEWHFSPAYDLLPSDGMNGYHTTSINDNIEPTRDDLLVVAVKAGLNKKEAEVIYSEIEEKVKKFCK